MKKFTIEKQLKNELRKSSASDFVGVWSKCEKSEGGRYEPNASEVAIKKIEFKRVLAIFTAGLLAVSFIIVSLWQFLSSSGSMRFTKGSFLLDVNPSIEVCYDEKGVVTSAIGLNEDGKVLLVGLDLVGNPYDKATEKIFSRLLALGYFSGSRDDNAVLASAVTENGGKDEKMLSALKTAFAENFSKKKVKGVVIDGVTNAELQSQSEKYGIDSQKYGLILSYLALGGELDESQYATISIRELYSAIEQKKSDLKELYAQEVQSVLLDFERKLNETLAEQIGVLVDTLGVYLCDEPQTQEKLENLQSAVVELEQTENAYQRREILSGIFKKLDELSAIQTDFFAVSMIESAKISISVVHEFFEKALKHLIVLKASPEKISEMRLHKFANYVEGSESFKQESWQQEKASYFSGDWFAIKGRWQEARSAEL